MSNGEPEPIGVIIGIVLSILFFIIDFILDLIDPDSSSIMFWSALGIGTTVSLLIYNLNHRRKAGLWPYQPV